MQKIKVLISNKQNVVKIPSGIRLLVRRCCHAVLNHEGFSQDAEVSVSFVDNADIQKLNSEYRQKDAPTDVLSFPLGENGEFDLNEETGAAVLGDIVLSMEKAYEQAEIYGHSLQREVAYLTVHSMFHLLGYDHEQGGLEAVRMREKEEAVLTSLGLPRSASYVMSDEN
ncbi:translation metalloprotein YbeY [[Clostridium] methylpentosum DSM 5476]|uniref:Endoribonuclease YbeY n=1 Tax=[Clostridium] methylpentosum DSM 5476 TaxID=537013 RepID=C0EFG1_9FIRM|nr:translation metalloprotein YbeY [[Clostridium] methylpentosum DSM 5476]MEE1492051.1 rRNA maturation RNase YbeY [Massilioclostridium sp.]